MNRQSPEYVLRIYSWLFICFALLGAAQLILGSILGEFSAEAIAAQTGADAATAQLSVVLLFVIAGLVTLLELLVGFMGLRQSRGHGQGRAHIVLAWIAMFFIGLSLVTAVVNAFSGTADWYAVCSPLASVCILGCFIKQARLTREANAERASKGSRAAS